MRAALKIAGYKDTAAPYHNEEVGGCRSECECGNDHAITKLPSMYRRLEPIFEAELDAEAEAFERGVEMRRDYEFEGRGEQFDRAVGIVERLHRNDTTSALRRSFS